MDRVLPLGRTLRFAIVTKVAQDHVDCQFYDKQAEKPFSCPVPHPYAGRGGGFLVGLEKDTVVLVASATNERWFIVAIVPSPDFFDVDSSNNIRVGETSYPELEEGEVCVKGNPGQKIHLLSNGNISMDAGIGDKSYDLELSNFAQGLFTRVDNLYTFTEAGRTVEGLIKRDLNNAEVADETYVTDFLAGESYEGLLSKVGRTPQSEAHVKSTKILKTTTRNPALIEKRDLTYEYADSFNVRGFATELRASTAITTGTTDQIQSSVTNLMKDPSIRGERRTDILDLNLSNYNHLIEEVKGTVVDIYGNILDLNRSKIIVPEVSTLLNKGDSDGLLGIYDALRRSVKYHFEINSRKAGITSDKPDDPPLDRLPDDNLKAHSRFSVDVDAEGLTKINIPASSDTGNIPVLGRYLVTNDPSNPDQALRDSTVNADQVDVRFAQFGATTSDHKSFTGPKIDGYGPSISSFYDLAQKQTKSTNIAGIDRTITVGTAFHDVLNTANSIIKNGTLKGNPPLNTPVRNASPQTSTDPLPNAGGRSLHMNLDGSLEASIGADTIDHKSMVLDLAGGMVSNVGSDSQGRSVVAQCDGYVMIQIGTSGGTSGAIELHVMRQSDPSNPHRIIIDDGGITIKSMGGLTLESEGDLILSSTKASVLINGETIQKYGAYNTTTRTIGGTEKLEHRDGR